MSFEEAATSARGNDTMLAKSFVIVAERDTLAWYSMLKPKSVYSWEYLGDKIMANFKGFANESLTSLIYFSANNIKENPLRLKHYYQRFMHLKARAPNVPKEVAIEAAIKGLRIGPFVGELAREKPSSIEELYNEFEKYCRSNNDLHKRMEEQN